MAYPLKPRRDDRRLARDRAFLLRRMSTPLRGLPSFLIVGAMKSGTSSLFSYLLQHPQIVPPLRKEIHYFGLGCHAGKTDNWYSAHFPRKRRLRDGAITGEATPDYMFSPGAGTRLAARLPTARLIVLLRDPVERAISHYFHEVRMGREYLPIDKAMAVEEDRLAAADRDGAGLETYLHASYKKRGVYVEQIENLLRAFPRDQILIQGSGTLFRTPAKAVAEALSFLGFPAMRRNRNFAVKNSGGNRAEVPHRVYADLQNFFAPHNTRLFDLLGRELDW